MIKFKVTFVLLTFLLGAQAQSGFVSAGGDVGNEDGSFSYSIGQVFFQYSENEWGNLNEGTQQVLEVQTVNLEERGLNIELSAFPNPVTNQLNVEFKEFNQHNYIYQLFDAQGVLIESKQINNQLTIINASDLPASVYFIHIINEDEKQKVKSFKIIKNR